MMSSKRHKESACHREAVDAMITLLSTTIHRRATLQSACCRQDEEQQGSPTNIISVIAFLCRQGLAMRRANDETDSNFSQSLSMKAHDDPNLASWLKRKKNVYTSATIQKLMKF